MTTSQAKILVIVNANTPISKLSKSTIRRIYLGKLLRFPRTNYIPMPIDQSQHSAVRAEFTRRILGMSTTHLMQYWSKRIFSGKGGLPTVVSSDQEVISVISRNVNAIGYVSGQINGKVKVVYQLS